MSEVLNIMNSKTKTIILLGKTGHGKSTFCNLLSDSFEFKVAAETDVNSCTKEIKKKEYDIKEENIKLVIIDTPGFSDSDGDDPNIIKDIKNYLLKKDLPRINSIIVIISIQEPKLDQSIQLFLGAMCQVFPLPKLWEHIILVWTHYYAGSENAKNNLKQKAANFQEKFMKLTETINRKYNISIQKIDKLKMIFNEYDENADEEIRKNNETSSKRNIKTIISWLKDMSPLYEDIVEEKDDEKIINKEVNGKNTYITKQKLKIRTYKDFSRDNIMLTEVISEYTIRKEESETDFELFNDKDGVKTYNKYKKYITYDSNGKIINNSKTNEVIDSYIEEEKQDTIPTKISDKITSFCVKKYILKKTKKNEKGDRINEKIIENYTEEWEDKEDIENNIDKDHLGTIKHKWKQILYRKKGNEKKEIDHRLLPNEEYEETYKKDEKPSEKNIEENGKKYNIKYYKIYKINSKDKSQKREYTNYEIIDEKNEIGLKEIFEAKLINKDAENEYYQNYKKIYKVDENGKETYIKEEKVGEVYPKKIKTITEYDIIGLSLEEIDNKRKEKSYPIQFKRVYYEKELNTENPLKNETGKTEEVSINIQHFTEEIDKENLEEFDKEFLIVEGIAIKDFEKEPKRNVVKKK